MSSSTRDGDEWFNSPAQRFGQFNPVTDDFLHPQIRAEGDTVSETQYFGISIPEENIYGFTYLWIHSNLNVATGGIFVCRGLKRSHMQAELFDLLSYMRADRVLANDLRSFELPNSYGVEVIEPGKSMRVRYNDAARGNAVDFVATATMPVAMRNNNLHFEQAMRLDGSVTLAGKRYEMKNSYTVRDRSWAQARPETNLSIPPVTWMTGVFSDDFAFNCNCFDSPERKPEWLGQLKLPGASNLNDGWVYSDGVLSHLKSADKITRRNPETGAPVSTEMVLVDDHGRRFEITGKVTAGLPWAQWSNMTVHLTMTRWECNGLVGWGDTQDVQWYDYIRTFTRPLSGPEGP